MDQCSRYFLRAVYIQYNLEEKGGGRDEVDERVRKVKR